MLSYTIHTISLISFIKMARFSLSLIKIWSERKKKKTIKGKFINIFYKAGNRIVSLVFIIYLVQWNAIILCSSFSFSGVVFKLIRFIVIEMQHPRTPQAKQVTKKVVRETTKIDKMIYNQSFYIRSAWKFSFNPRAFQCFSILT